MIIISAWGSAWGDAWGDAWGVVIRAPSFAHRLGVARESRVISVTDDPRALAVSRALQVILVMRASRNLSIRVD